MEKKGNTKLIWYILFALITIIMCYLFCVVYFFYISPNNISVKTKIWPFLTNSQLGQLYNEAVVDISYKVEDEEYFGCVEVSVSGVNVRKDGYIIAALSDFSSVNETTQLQVFAKSGEVFEAKMIYSDKNHNLAIIKCISLENAAIKLPFVKLCKDQNSVFLNQELIAINSENKKTFTGKVTDCDLVDAKTSASEGIYKVDYVMEYCFSANIENFAGGMVFDKEGYLLGFSVDVYDGEQVFMPAYAASLYLDEVVSAHKANETYTNALVDSFVGFDSYEVQFLIEESSKNSEKSKFYFNGSVQEFTDNINYFSRANQTGFYLFDSLIYNEIEVLKSENVISRISFDGDSYEIACKADLMSVLYGAKEGKMTIYYYAIDSLGSHIKSVSFDV